MKIAIGFVGALFWWSTSLVSAFVPTSVCRPCLRHKGLWRLNNIREDALSNELEQVEETLGVSTKDSSSLQSRPMKVTDGVAFIAGTAVGGGFLALPNFTTPIGYLPTVVGLLFAYIFLVLSAIAFIEAAALTDADKRKEASVRQDATYTGGTSVASIIRWAFGPRWAVLGGFAFLAQMLAVMTAQVVKGAELLSFLTGISYRTACIVPFACIGLFVYVSSSEFVEGFNTILTAVMLGGFAALMIGAFSRADLLSGLFQKSNWWRLLPSTKAPFAMPIFVKLLAFGEAMPFLVERMAFGTLKGTASKHGNEIEIKRQSAYRSVRRATVIGAGLPLLLAVIWAGISAALVDPFNPNPIFSLIGNYGPSISIPVWLLSYGAIGTTLLGSLLAMTHFAKDMIFSKLGYSSKRFTAVASCLTVVLPCLLACIGPSLYIPLLAFAGAYPTTLLYGLAPSLAAFTLRRRANWHVDGELSEPPRLVPGGDRTLIALVVWSIGLVGASSLLAVRQLLVAFM